MLDRPKLPFLLRRSSGELYFSPGSGGVPLFPPALTCSPVFPRTVPGAGRVMRASPVIPAALRLSLASFISFSFFRATPGVVLTFPRPTELFSRRSSLKSCNTEDFGRFMLVPPCFLCIFSLFLLYTRILTPGTASVFFLGCTSLKSCSESECGSFTLVLPCIPSFITVYSSFYACPSIRDTLLASHSSRFVIRKNVAALR